MKKLISIALSGIMAMSALVSSASAQTITINFTDCDNVSWASTAIETFVANGSVTGTSYDEATNTGTFSPDEEFTREQLAKVITIAFALDTNTAYDTQTYSDVSPTYWAYEYVEAIAEYMPGYSVPSSSLPVFRGAVSATRETIMVTVAKVLRTVDMSDDAANAILEKYEDASDISYQMRPKVADMINKGVINGYEIDGKWYIKPQDSVTRAEAITILYRATYGDVTIKNLVYPETITDDTFILTGETDAGARVWINNIEGTVDDYGHFTSQPISVDSDATSVSVAIRAEKNSSTNTMTVSIPVELGAPKINIINYPQTTDDDSATIYGNITDDNMDGMQLYINNKLVTLDSAGGFSYTADLDYGSNTITIKAVNKLNIQTVEELTITRGNDTPSISILTTVPSTTESSPITVNVRFSNYEKIYFNNIGVTADSSGDVSYSWNLVDGENNLEIKVVSPSNEIVTKTLTTTYTDPTVVEEEEIVVEEETVVVDNPAVDIEILD